MVTASPLLAAFERRFQQEAFAHRGLPDALVRYAALWAYAREVNPDVGTDWQGDLEPDLAVARAVNGLSPAS